MRLKNKADLLITHGRQFIGGKSAKLLAIQQDCAARSDVQRSNDGDYIGHKLAPMYHGLPSFARRALRRMVERVPPSTKKVTLEFLLKRFVHDAEKPSQSVSDPSASSAARMASACTKAYPESASGCCTPLLYDATAVRYQTNRHLARISPLSLAACA